MKKLLGFLVVIGFAVALSAGSTGCTKTDKDKDKDKKEKEKAKQVTVTTDPDSAVIKAETAKAVTKEITVKIARGKEAKADATLTVDPASKDGVTAKLTDAKLTGDKDKTTLTIEVEKAAKAGEVKITVTCKSEGSKDTSANITIKVEAAAGAVVEPPAKDYKLEVAKSEDAKGKLKGELKFKFAVTVGADQKDVKLTVGVKGKDDMASDKVTAKLDKDTIEKTGDVTVTATVTIAADAAVGDYTVWVTAAGTEKKTSTGTAKVTVAAN